MQKHLFRITIFATLLNSSLGFAIPESKCHIRNPIPLLQKEAYKNSNYQLSNLSQAPVTLKESVALRKNLNLTIQQQGCEDEKVTFTIDFSDKPKEITNAQAQEAIDIVRNLKLNPDAFVTSKELSEFAKGAANKLKRDGVKGLSGYVVVLHTVNQEVITDVEISKTESGFLFHYVDRP